MHEKVLLLGGSGYIGRAFQSELERREIEHFNLTRKCSDYTHFDTLVRFIQDFQPTFLINCAGFTGKPNVDACEQFRADALLGNVNLPQTILHACSLTQTPWGHVSSGCIYSGAKVRGLDGELSVEQDLLKPEVQAKWSENPSALEGFFETDAPNFSFRHPPCSFYSGSKALGEEVLSAGRETYVWRLRIPFDQFESPRNYLTKLLTYPRTYNNVNSLSHRGDFANACLDLWLSHAPFGTYNVTNPGWVTTHQVIEMIQSVLRPTRTFEFFADDEEFYRSAARAPRSNTILDTSKLLAAGIKIREVHEAIESALTQWTPVK